MLRTLDYPTINLNPCQLALHHDNARPSQTDGRTNITAIARRFVLTNPLRANTLTVQFIVTISSHFVLFVECFSASQSYRVNLTRINYAFVTMFSPSNAVLPLLARPSSKRGLHKSCREKFFAKITTSTGAKSAGACRNN